MSVLAALDESRRQLGAFLACRPPPPIGQRIWLAYLAEHKQSVGVKKNGRSSRGVAHAKNTAH